MKSFIIIIMLLLVFVTLYTLTFSNLTQFQALVVCFVVGFTFTFLVKTYYGLFLFRM